MTFPFPPAPFPGLDDAQRAAMLALGPTWAQDIQENRRRVCDIYDAIHGALPADDLRVAPAQAYGDDPRQQLDLYLPIAHDQTARPIVAFVHGGAFLRGNKDATPHIYANVPRLFARAGCIGVNIEYRLAPRAPYPAGADDVAAAVGWLREHAAAWGGDPERIVLLGHSAGGSHVATFLTDPRYKGQAQGVTAAALISARLDADTLPGNPNAAGVVAYYGADPAQQRRHAPMAHAEAMTVPLMVAVAEYENPYLDLYALQYAARVAAAGRMPRIVQVARHNHTSIVAHLGSADREFATALLDFVQAHAAPARPSVRRSRARPIILRNPTCHILPCTACSPRGQSLPRGRLPQRARLCRSLQTARRGRRRPGDLRHK